MGSVAILSVGVLYSCVEGVWGGLSDLDFLAIKTALPLEAIEVVMVLCAE